MDLNVIRENMKKDFNCILITVINYANHDFAKGFETIEGGISYRYFKVRKDNTLAEIKDELLLAYFRKMNETNDDNNY